MKYTKHIIGNFQGDDVYEIKLFTDSGTFMSFWTLGARLNEFNLDGIGNIVLSYDSIDQLLANRSYFFGASIGRMGGRIGNSSFKLNGTVYNLDNNEGSNHLHGGDRGFDLRNWEFDIEEGPNQFRINFKLMDKKYENYYPGNLKARVSHTLTNDEKWIIDYWAKSDADTIYNPTNHVYFNLNGEKNLITNHYLKLDSNYILETDKSCLPTGKKIEIKSTELDFSTYSLLGDVLISENPEIAKNGGLDTAFVLNRDNQISLSLKNDKLKLDMITDRDSVIVYSLNKIDEESSMKLFKHQGIAIEAQNLPDAINHKGFGNVILKKGEEFKSQTTYRIERL